MAWGNQNPTLEDLQRQQQQWGYLQQSSMQSGNPIVAFLSTLMGGRAGNRADAMAKSEEDKQREALQRLGMMLAGGDTEGPPSLEQQQITSAMDVDPRIGLDLAKEYRDSQKPKEVPANILQGMTEESQLEYMRTGDVSVLKPKVKGPKFQNGYWVDETAMTVEPVPEYLAARERIRAAGRPTTVVNVGGHSPLTKSTTNAVQKTVIGLERSLRQLDGIAKTFDSGSLTYKGQASTAVARQAEKMGLPVSDDAKKSLASRTQFRNAILQTFNDYRVAVTGAAASDKEQERLLDSMFNPNQSESEFRASYTLFRDRIAQDLAEQKRLLALGLPLEATQAAAAEIPFDATPAAKTDVGIESADLNAKAAGAEHDIPADERDYLIANKGNKEVIAAAVRDYGQAAVSRIIGGK